MKQEIVTGTTDYTAFILIRDTAGAAKTGLTFESAGLDVSYARMETDNDVVVTAGAPVTTTLTGAHVDWGFVEVDATNHPGLYKLDIADGVFAAGAWSVVVTVIGTGLDPTHIEYILRTYNFNTLYSAVVARTGVATAGATRSITLDAGASAVNNYYIDDIVSIISGTGAGQSRRIKSYVGASKVATVQTAWGTNPAAGSVYVLIPGGKTAAVDSPQTAVVTTIATLASQTSFTLTDGSADNNAYVNMRCLITDAANTFQIAMGYISAYTGTTKTVTLRSDPAIFTMAVGDQVQILLDATNEAMIADAVWDEAQADHVGAGTFGITASEIAEVLVDTSTTLDGKIDALENLSSDEMKILIQNAFTIWCRLRGMNN